MCSLHCATFMVTPSHRIARGVEVYFLLKKYTNIQQPEWRGVGGDYKKLNFFKSAPKKSKVFLDH